MITADTFRLDGRLALVTGSSTGIGLALARGLAQAGATVVLNARNASRLAQTVATLQAEGLPAHARAFDVADPAAVAAAVDAIESELGPIEILANNAGGNRRSRFVDITMDDWRSVMDTNLDGLFVVGQAVARRMVTRRRGRIVNTCSVTSEMVRPGVAAYAASKGAAKMLTKAMAVELGPQGINVNGIGPGYFRTEMTAPLAGDANFNTWLLERTPLGRWGELDDLAPAVVFLASDAARFVNGHILYVDGGITASL